MTTRRRRVYDPGPPCYTCGYFRNNVRHEADPDHAPEGRAYFDEMRSELHAFVGPEHAVGMNCGHPLAARRITRLPEGFRTDCWACSVQREVVARIVGPRAAKRRDVAW